MSRPKRSLQANEDWVLEFAKSALQSNDIAKQHVQVQEWRNSSIYTVQLDTKSCIIKSFKTVDLSRVEQWQKDVNELAGRLECSNTLLVIPKVLDIHRQTASVALERIQGEPGGPWLAHRLHKGSALNEITPVIENWGRAFALFHSNSLGERFTESAQTQAETRVEQIFSKLRLTPKAFSRMTPGIRPCRGHNDVGFHNVILTEDRRVGFIDFFEAELVTSIHEDVADIIAWLHDAVRDVAWHQRYQAQQTLSETFLAAYGKEAQIDFRAPPHRDLLAMFLTRAHLQWTKTAFRRRHKIQTLGCLLRSSKAALQINYYCRR